MDAEKIQEHVDKANANKTNPGFVKVATVDLVDLCETAIDFDENAELDDIVDIAVIKGLFISTAFWRNWRDRLKRPIPPNRQSNIYATHYHTLVSLVAKLKGKTKTDKPAKPDK